LFGRERLRKASVERLRPGAHYLGIWAAYELHPRLAVGVDLSTAVRISPCAEQEPCLDSKLTRLGGLIEGKHTLVGDRLQALEAFASLAPSLMFTTERRPDSGYRATDTPWGAGLTGKLGPRVFMRWLTIGPYVEGCVHTVGTHLAYGYGLQLGLRRD
jgi:hypothetical protein